MSLLGYKNVTAGSYSTLEQSPNTSIISLQVNYGPVSEAKSNKF